MGRKYHNAPIIEVVCEFIFTPNSPWDLALPGLIYERLRNTFEKRTQETIVAVEVTPGISNTLPAFRTEERIRLTQADEQAFIILGKHSISIHHVKPYPSWEKFFPLIRQAFESYTSVAEPVGIHRIGLRYINRIEVDGGRVEPSEYFSLYPYVGPGLPEDYSEFATRVLFPYQGGRDLLKVELASGKPDRPNTMVSFLDLDYILAQPDSIEPNDAMAWIVDAHNHIENVFEESITNRLREQFREEAT